MTRSLVNIEGLAEAERQLKEINDQIGPLLERRERIEKRVALARQLQAMESGDTTAEQPQAVNPSTNSPTLVDAVPLVLERHGPLRPADIRAKLDTVGFSQPYNENYFYTVISRLNKAGTIVRLPDKRLSLPAPQDTAASTNSAMH